MLCNREGEGVDNREGGGLIMLAFVLLFFCLLFFVVFLFLLVFLPSGFYLF